MSCLHQPVLMSSLHQPSQLIRLRHKRMVHVRMRFLCGENVAIKGKAYPILPIPFFFFAMKKVTKTCQLHPSLLFLLFLHSLPAFSLPLTSRATNSFLFVDPGNKWPRFSAFFPPSLLPHFLPPPPHYIPLPRGLSSRSHGSRLPLPLFAYLSLRRRFPHIFSCTWYLLTFYRSP